MIPILLGLSHGGQSSSSTYRMRTCCPPPRFPLPSCASCSSARLGRVLVVVASVCCRQAEYSAAAASFRASKSISTIRRRRLLLLPPPLSCTPSSCVRFGDARSGAAVCGDSAAAVCWACFVRMNSTSLFALRRCREFRLLGEQTEALCALAVPAPAVSPAGAWRVLPAFSPAIVRASSSLLVRVLPCTLVLRRGRRLSGDPVGVDGGLCALAVPPPAAYQPPVQPAQPSALPWPVQVHSTTFGI